MPNVRFTISTASDVLAAIREHADAAGMDVSAYMVAAAAAQMASDDAITATFASLDALNQATLDEAASLPEPELPSFESLAEGEQAWVREILSSALGPEHPDIP